MFRWSKPANNTVYITKDTTDASDIIASIFVFCDVVCCSKVVCVTHLMINYCVDCLKVGSCVVPLLKDGLGPTKSQKIKKA